MPSDIAEPSNAKRQRISRNAEEKAKLKAQNAALKTAKRREKTKLLGLHWDSPLPAFTYKLKSIEDVQNHSQLQEWHAHRQDMVEGRLVQSQLPSQFQSIRGKYKFPKIKEEAQEGGKSKRQRKDQRGPKAKELGLDRKSAVPKFALHLTPIETRKHPQLGNWHRYREMVEHGIIGQEDLPDQFKSRIPGSLHFRIPKKRGPAPPKDGLTLKERHNLQSRFRRAKLKTLELEPGSAIPIFAERLTVEELKGRSKDLDSWHHYRALLVNGHITVNDLPEQFKANKGILTFRPSSYIPKGRGRLPLAGHETGQLSLHDRETSEQGGEYPLSDVLGISIKFRVKQVILHQANSRSILLRMAAILGLFFTRSYMTKAVQVGGEAIHYSS